MAIGDLNQLNIPPVPPMPGQQQAQPEQEEDILQYFQQTYPNLFQEGVNPLYAMFQLRQLEPERFAQFQQQLQNQRPPQDQQLQNIRDQREQVLQSVGQGQGQQQPTFIDKLRDAVNRAHNAAGMGPEARLPQAQAIANSLNGIVDKFGSRGQQSDDPYAARTETFQRFTPEQQALMSRLGGLGLQSIENPREAFAPIAQQARQDFAQKTLPSIAERFTQMGGQKSSAFPQILGQQAAGLESQLAALGSQFGQQQQQIGTGLSRLALQPSIDTLYRPRENSFGQSLALGALSPILSGLGGAAKEWVKGRMINKLNPTNPIG